MLVRPPLQGIVLISDILRAELQADCSVLMGANVANDMASDAFCETTIGYTNDANGELFKLAYDDPALKVGTVKDTVGVELCGALKNIVAIGAGPRSAAAAYAAAYTVNSDARAAATRHLRFSTAGFVDGLGFGGNTKAAIIRIGLKEMVKFCKMVRRRPYKRNARALACALARALARASPTHACTWRVCLARVLGWSQFYDGIQDDTFLESCGVADLITTCYGGRNRKCAEAFAAAGKMKSLDEIEAELLGGQKLQGTLTAKEVNHILKMKGLEHEFPFFTTVYKISYEDTPLSAITETPY